MKRSLIILLVAVVVSAGCVKRPKGVLSDDKMIPVLADMEISEGYLHSQGANVDREQLRASIVEGILQKYKIKRADFDSTMSWYGRNPDVYCKLEVKIGREIDKREKIYSGENNLAETGNDNNLWPYMPMSYIDGRNGSEVLKFSMAGSEISPGNLLRWRMRLSKEADATVMLGVEYDNGISSYLSQRMNGRKGIELELQTDTVLKVERIYGHLSFEDPSELPLWVDSIFLNTAPIDSTKYFKIHHQRSVSRPRHIPVETKSLFKNKT